MNRREFLASLTAAAAAVALPVPAQALPGGWVLEGDTLVLRGAKMTFDAPLKIPEIGKRILIDRCDLTFELYKMPVQTPLDLSDDFFDSIEFRDCDIEFQHGWRSFGDGAAVRVDT